MKPAEEPAAWGGHLVQKKETETPLGHSNIKMYLDVWMLVRWRTHMCRLLTMHVTFGALAHKTQ